MTYDDALLVLKLLADGKDPDYGTAVGPNSVVNRPEVVRALHLAVEILDGRVRFERKKKTHPKLGQKWTTEEESRLAAGFDQGRPLHDLAKTHERSIAGVEERLIRLGKLKRPSPYQNYMRRRWGSLTGCLTGTSYRGAR